LLVIAVVNETSEWCGVVTGAVMSILGKPCIHWKCLSCRNYDTQTCHLKETLCCI